MEVIRAVIEIFYIDRRLTAGNGLDKDARIAAENKVAALKVVLCEGRRADRKNRVSVRSHPGVETQPEVFGMRPDEDALDAFVRKQCVDQALDGRLVNVLA